MKTFSIEDLRSIISDIRNSEEKKNLYILLGVFVAVAAIAVGIAAIVIKKHCEEKYDDDLLSQKVYDYLTTIPKGKVVTYKQIGDFLGNKGLARAIGNILHKNPDGDKYPCYKVLNSKGELAEAFVFGGKDIQRKRLEKDGIKVVNNKVDLKIYQWKEKEKKYHIVKMFFNE